MEPAEFVTTLWGEKPPGKLLVWTLPDKKSYWFNNETLHVQDIEWTLSKTSRTDVYTSMMALPQSHPERPNAKYKKDHQLAAMSCLWADIDIQHELHAKRDRLPPDQGAALQIIEELPYQPTVINHTGHGLQAFWVFEQPWIFKDRAEQELAARIARWWDKKIKATCRAHGWTTDSVWDVTRVMRIPGFTNWKDPENPKPVITVVADGPRMDLKQLLKQVPEMTDENDLEEPEPAGASNKKASQEPKPDGSASKWAYTMGADAKPPQDKLLAMLDNLPDFRATWELRRKDFTNDNSPSAYDMSLASQAAGAGWTNQEIINLLIAFRVKHGLPLKLRQNYFRPTLAKARRSQKNDRSNQRIEEIVEDISTEPGLIPDFVPDAAAPTGESTQESEAGDSKQRIRNNLADLWGFRIRQIIRSMGDPPTFWMATSHGEITIGKIENLTNQRSFINFVAACTKILIPPARPKEWSQHLKALLYLIEDEDLGPASHPNEEIREWTIQYLEERRIESDDRVGAMNQRQPFFHKSRLHIFQDDLREWLRTRLHTDMTVHTLSQRMRRAGFESERTHIAKDSKDQDNAPSVEEEEEENGNQTGGRTTRYTWKIPIGLEAEPQAGLNPPEGNNHAGNGSL